MLNKLYETKPISMAYFINPFSFLGNRSVELYSGNEYTKTNKIRFGRIIFYAVLLVSEESRQFFLELMFSVPDVTIF
jgi:hypothetical protein